MPDEKDFIIITKDGRVIPANVEIVKDDLFKIRPKSMIDPSLFFGATAVASGTDYPPKGYLGYILHETKVSEKNAKGDIFVNITGNDNIVNINGSATFDRIKQEIKQNNEITDNSKKENLISMVDQMDKSKDTSLFNDIFFKFIPLVTCYYGLYESIKPYLPILKSYLLK
jgi:hypothetical protein